MRCKVRRAGWPSDKATSSNEVPRKLSFQEASPTLQCQNKDVLRLGATECYTNSLLPKSVGQDSVCLATSFRPPPSKKKEIKPKHFCLDKATVSCTFRRGMRIVAPLDSNVTSVSVPGETGSAYITEQNFGTFVVFRF